jgi:diketogulonate reductase-like aldo/keto reductase
LIAPTPFQPQDQQTFDAVHNGIELGYRHIDTAQIYNNEADVGRVITASKTPVSELFVTTKIWTDNLAKGKLIPSLKESLQKLQLDKVNLTLIHWPSPNDEIPVAAYMRLAYGKAMQEPVIQKIAQKHNATAAQIALAWSLQQDFAVIPSSTKRENLQSNLLTAKITLSDDEMNAIAKLDNSERIANPGFAPAWD